jgi:UDP-N-acetyl-alpha-D-muramoyl-L-alanyl-L-glutamate epimerase
LQVEQLRIKHPFISYDEFKVERVGDSLKVAFRFTLEPGISFKPEVIFESVNWARVDELDPAVLNNLFFHLGLVETLSYWKAACSPEILIRAGSISEEQADWWRDLLLHGMGEYFYVNKIDYRQPGFVRIVSETGPKEGADRYEAARPGDRSLVLTSGGKDTALTLQLLQAAEKDFGCLLLNPAQAAIDLANIAAPQELLIVRRTIDPALLELNRNGYLNGHTPFSAYLAFLGVIQAVLGGYDQVIVSNERSSDEGNVEFLGSEVNHQYSKSFRFERKFQAYVARYISPTIYYFSLLRPLYDIQISRLLAEYPGCLPVFKSCNRNQRENSWCGRCPKCVSVYTLLYPFVGRAAMMRIFGRDLYESVETIRFIEELAGLTEHKPFECVGTVKETFAALHFSLCQAGSEQGSLPPALQFCREKVLPLNPNIGEQAESLMLAWGDEHALPPAYESLIKAQLKRVDSNQSGLLAACQSSAIENS